MGPHGPLWAHTEPMRPMDPYGTHMAPMGPMGPIGPVGRRRRSVGRQRSVGGWRSIGGGRSAAAVGGGGRSQTPISKVKHIYVNFQIYCYVLSIGFLCLNLVSLQQCTKFKVSNNVWTIVHQIPRTQFIHVHFNSSHTHTQMHRQWVGCGEMDRLRQCTSIV